MRDREETGVGRAGEQRAARSRMLRASNKRCPTLSLINARSIHLEPREKGEKSRQEMRERI